MVFPYEMNGTAPPGDALNVNTKLPMLKHGLGRTVKLCTYKLPKLAVKVNIMASV
jgi:hypothetical protein